MRLRTLFLLTVAPYVFVGAIIAAVLAVTGTDGGSDASRPGPTAVATTTVERVPAPATTPTAAPTARPTVSREDQLHQDYNMTQYMSDSNASGPMFTGQLTDAQLEHSSDPAFVRELEQHQRDIDRMLARGEP
jgi:hypothetical protein